MPFLQGWLGSIAFHGLVLLSLFPLFRQSLITIHNEPFHWDVALVQSTPTADEPVQPAGTTEPTVSKHPQQALSPARANRTNRQAAPSAERSTSLALKTEAPFTPTSITDGPSSVTSSSETVTTSIPNELPSPLVQATEPPGQPTEMPIGSTTQAPAQLETAVAAAPVKESARSVDAIQASPVLATASETTAVSAIRPDYGWLQQAIFHRLEELKRSSRPLLDQSRPLQVLVRAIVSHEGTLLDAEVVKSSGLDRIDQEAMGLVQQAFPMHLDRPLDREQVAMRIPITYSHE